jgi:2-polyprenyl-3-methyl-5-hydroxy-6-metoxy-1,4-benzoquinol methylase
MRLCDCCGKDHVEPVTHKRGYGINLCINCGLFFVSPQPTDEELNRIYSASQGYFATAKTNLSAVPSDKADRLHNIVTSLGVNPGDFLDVGCASGYLLYHMRKHGWRVRGNDLNEGALEIARQHGFDVVHGTLEDCAFPDNSFDAINVGDLIEHVKSPRKLMTEVYRILRPGGVVAILTPNAECGLAKSSLAFSRFTNFPWIHSEAPYHLFDFSPKTLTSMLSDIGFRTESVTYREGGSFAYLVGATGYFDNLKQDIKRSGKYRLNSKVALALPALLLVSATVFPLWLWGRFNDRARHSGRSMTVVARKQTK